MSSIRKETLNIEEILLLVMKVLNRGDVEKTDKGYLLRFGDIKEYIIELKADNIEFRIPTIKWVTGSYEPVEGSELYKCISYSELIFLSEEDKVKKLKQIIEEL